MKKLLFLLVLLVCLVAGPSISNAQYGKESGIWDFKDEVHDSVFLIKVPHTQPDGSIGYGYGTGFIFKIEKDKEVGDGYYGYALTAAHVCGESGNKGMEIFYQNGRTAKDVYVVSSNSLTDLAIIKIWVPKGIEAIELAAEAPKKGDKVEIVGYGYTGRNRKIEQRRFYGIIDGPDFLDAFFINQSVVPGDSGGLVMNEKGQIVGVIQAGIVRYQWDESDLNKYVVWPTKCGTLKCIKEICEHFLK